MHAFIIDRNIENIRLTEEISCAEIVSYDI